MVPDLLVKGITSQMHRRLKEAARRHHRSMNKEALSILEENLSVNTPIVPDVQPFKGSLRITGAWLEKAIRSGRA